MLKHKVLALAALLLTAAASAQTNSAQAENDWDKRWYLGPSVGVAFSDASDLDAGPQASIVVGRSITPYTGFELEGGYSALKVSHLPSENKYQRAVLGLNLVQYLAPEDWTVRPYLLANANGHSIKFLGETLGGFGVGAGLGAFLNLSTNWDLRLEGRYNLDFINQKGIVPSSTFYIWTAGLGVRYKFGDDPHDEDGDGVPNSRDKCPHTPHGVVVNSDGCPPDSDHDGVPDYLDKCPGTPPGVTVNVNGCPIDSDGDGVPDYLDKCPNTPRGVAVDKTGCPIPLADSDHDGVPDNLDKCPNTPLGQKVGPDGCPLDSDGDGIPDDQDECPNTPAGAKVLPNGCALKGDCRRPRAGEQVDEHGCALEHNFILKGVKFEFDSDRLTAPAKEILNQVAETLKAYPELNVEVQGHTDYVGTDAYNLGLSEKRSNSVKAYLVSHGVNGKRLTPVGYGKTRPIDTNETEAGRENNRRVELKVLE
jgi:OOP family OmpA-OmpF porin